MNTDSKEQILEKATFPLSFAQMRIWLLDQFELGKSTNYNMPIFVRLEGDLDAPALDKALNALIERHESFRTTYTIEKGDPIQVISPTGSLKLAFMDLSALPPEAREAETKRLLLEEAQTPFDLTKDILLRARLIRHSAREHILTTCFHHIGADGWSLNVFYNELALLYEGYAKGAPPQLPALPIQYADYTVWQQECMKGGILDEHQAYWKKQLAGAPPLLEIPLDFKRPPTQSYQGAKHLFYISSDITNKLRALAQEEGCTLFMTLLTVFQTLIARYTGVDDIIVGTPIAHRTCKDLEGLIGCFINILALRGDLSGDPTFREALQRLRKVTIDAYAHQDMPFEKLVDELQLERYQSYSPVFQIFFTLQNIPNEPETFGALKAEINEFDSNTSKTDLSFYLWETTEGLRAGLEFATDLYELATIKRLATHFQNLLKAVVAHPEERLSQFCFLTEEEKCHLLVELNQTRQAYPAADSITALIEAKVKERPESIAVVWKNERLTYRELNARANRLAAHLRKLGAGPEVLVALCLERTHEMIVTLLAIHKAGAAYVPLDPHYPKERLAIVLEDSKAPLLFTQKSLRTSVPTSAAKMVCLEDLELKNESPENFPSGVKPNHLAYVLFTSGSTGRPKGVAIEHRSVINYIEWMRALLKPGDLDGILFSTSICFDISVIEVFVALSLGGKIIVADNALALPTLEAASEVQCINTVPSAIAELVQTGGIPRSVRKLCLGGEALSQALVEKLYQYAPFETIFDFYGPTETTVYSTFAKRTAGGFHTIGRPIANTEIYILDAHRQPVPLGVSGEIYIGGAGLARGYWNRPDLTEEKFVPHPFSREAGARLYRTGDLARYFPDGTIEYIGRVDNQVKIRGFRIELGDIEAGLRSFPGISDVVVTARDNGAEDKVLVAYIVALKEPSIAELREHLKQKIPDYMIPCAFIRLPALPLTPNGKVDRKALPAPELVQSEKTLVPPRDAVDRQLLKIWKTLFKREDVGIRDDFFELGGHSLLAVRLFMNIETFSGRRLPLATLFEAATIEKLSDLLRKEGWESPWLCLVPIKPSGSRPPFYCVHGVGGNIIEYLDLAKHLDPDQPFYGIQAIGLSGKHPWQHKVEDMAATYVKEIRSFQPEGPYFLGGSSFGGLVAFEMAKLLRADNQEVRFLAFFDTHAPGYPKMLPTRSRILSRFDHLRFRFSLHWDNLVAAQGVERLYYVRDKIRKYSYGRYLMFRRYRKRTLDWIEELFYPREIKQTKQAGYQAILSYAPERYIGSATIFRASVQPLGTYLDPALGWHDFIEGKLEIYETPGHHGSIVRNPRARVLASQLTEALNRAQANEAPAVSKSEQGYKVSEPERAKVGTMQPTAEVPTPFH